MVRTLLRSLAVAGPLAAPAPAHDGCDRCFPEFPAEVPGLPHRDAALRARLGVRRPVHHHEWIRRDERVWVEPIVELRVVGYDAVPPADPAPRRRPRRLLDGPLRRDLLVRPDAPPLNEAPARAGAGTDRRPRAVAGERPASPPSSIDTSRRVPILGSMTSSRSLFRCRSRSRMLHALAFVALAVAAARSGPAAAEPSAFA